MGRSDLGTEIGPGSWAIPEQNVRDHRAHTVMSGEGTNPEQRPTRAPTLRHDMGSGARLHARARLLPALGVLFFRGLLVVPFVFMAPEIISLVLRHPNSVANVSASTADVLGTSSLLLFVMMLAVTPVHTMTGWRWHLILRRDYGVAMFFTAGTDLTLAALTTGDTFPGGPLARIAGHSFLVFGTLSVFLLVPLTLTANHRAMHWLGGHWKSVQRLTYVVWVTILIHLGFLFGFSSFFIDALAVSAPLAMMRLPVVRRWWRSARKARTHQLLRVGTACALIGLFSVGYTQLVVELAAKGSAAFMQRPASD